MGETRKLIEQGGGGLVAYIPKQWCDSKGLEAGDEVVFEEADDGLRVSADTTPAQKQTSVRFTDEGRRSVWILVNHLYRAGYDRIRVDYRDDAQYTALEDVVEQYLLGFEVVEDGDGTAVVANVTEPGTDKRRMLTRRIFLLIDELFDLLQAAMQDGSYNATDRVQEIRRKVGQYDNFCRRTLSKKRFAQGDAAFRWLLYVQLYLVSHNLIHFYETLADTAAAVSSETQELLATLHDHYTTMYEGFFEEDVDALNAVNTPLDELYHRMQRDHLTESTGAEAVAQYYVTELARLLYKTNSYPLLGVVFAQDTDETMDDAV